ncbi:MAG: DNA gyrase subunit A [Rhodobacteraceae bacterium]|nr:DNA gyrase subunit A [Paracoccaceae bacterium]
MHPAYDGPGVSIVEEMRTAYLDYAMSVIVSRAIPDLRDGLKPVHRRILYAMHETGNSHDKPYRKSARPVGDVMGKYHPHGDAAIYDALVRMAQDFSMSQPLLDGQGNFGSLDGDNPAAMRYTEIRMAKAAQWLLTDIDRNTVEFQDNYDGKDQEPSVLPARFPNVLVNGGGGIAVGMATNIPPHNLGEVISATLAYIENPDISIEGLMQLMPAPDFPTGGVIQGRTGAKKTYFTGRGGIVIRAKTRIETIRQDRQAIIVDEIPYQVNKATMIERIAEAVRDKKIEGIAAVRDESDRVGVRVVIELKRDANAEIVLNQLWRFSPMESSFNSNMLALNGGRPELMNLSTFIRAFVEFREEIVARRTADELRRARDRSHLLCGLAVVVSNLDQVVAIIRQAADPAEARAELRRRQWPAEEIADYLRLIDDPLNSIEPNGTYRLSDAQARAILELRLQRLTAMGIKENTDELQALAEKITGYLHVLGSGSRIRAIIADELKEVKENFAVARRTEIAEFEEIVDDEDLIEPENVVVTITNGGYIKRTPLSEFRSQLRGGKGLSGMTTKNEDFVTAQYVVNTHDALLFFTTDGIVYKLKAWRLPNAGRNARGKAIVNILPITLGVSIAAVTPIDVDESEWDSRQIVFATSAGQVRRNRLSDFANVLSNGKIAMRLPEGVTLVGARICSNDDDVLLASHFGRAIRFSVTEVRVQKSRNSTGMRGMRLKEGDSVVAMEIIRSFDASREQAKAFLKARRASGSPVDDEVVEESAADSDAGHPDNYSELQEAEQVLLTIASDGSGKRSSSYDYFRKGRGGMGVKAVREGRIVAFLLVDADDQVMLATNLGQSIRCRVSDISFRSRSAGGVRVFKMAKGSEVVSVARIAYPVDEPEEDAENLEQAVLDGGE